MKDVFIIETYSKKDGTEGSFWHKVGSSFGTNKDGSMSFTLCFCPGVKFQIRDRKEKETTDGEGF